ncbi:MAG: pantetheine-phosphate adenylyltransferase [Pseudomonadota bacterium]
MVRRGFFPGSFDPITNGHLDVIRAGLTVCDELIVGVGQNPNKTPTLPVEVRCALIERIARELPQGTERPATVRAVGFSGLLVKTAREMGANILLRGLRDGADFDYEMQMTGMNAAMEPELETIFVPARPANRHITATLVRQIAQMGGDISPFVPQAVAQALATTKSPS